MHTIDDVTSEVIKCDLNRQCPLLSGELLLKCLDLKASKNLCIHDPAILCECDEECPMLSKCTNLLSKSNFGVCVPTPKTGGNYSF